jgi:hypothetical protein
VDQADLHDLLQQSTVLVLGANGAAGPEHGLQIEIRELARVQRMRRVSGSAVDGTVVGEQIGEPALEVLQLGRRAPASVGVVRIAQVVAGEPLAAVLPEAQGGLLERE